MLSVIRLMRPHHCIKNALLFLPAVFSGKLLDADTLVTLIFGFFAFFFISSAVYVVNDLRDMEKDKLHSTKCHRPLASGSVSKRTATALAAILVVLSVLFSVFLCKSIFGLLILVLYFALNIGYSMGLKEIPIVDIIILVSGFILRLFFGSAITGIPISGWMYLTVMSASFYLGFGKRRNELAKSGEKTRKVLKFYTYEFLNRNMGLFSTLLIIFYALWCTSPDISERFDGKMLWTVPLLVLIFVKYSFDIEGDSNADPVEVLISDKSLFLLCGVFAVMLLLIIYL